MSDGIFDDLEDNTYLMDDLKRLAYTYAMFIFVAVILVKFQSLEYTHVFVITFMYMLVTFLVEMAWLYGLGDYRSATTGQCSAKSGDSISATAGVDCPKLGSTTCNSNSNCAWTATSVTAVGGDGVQVKLYGDATDSDNYTPAPSARTTFHNILNNVLPFTVLIFGYAILLDAFRSEGFSSDGQHIEFYIRGITGIVFVIGLGYLFYNLMNEMYGTHGPGDGKRRSLGVWLQSRFDPDEPDYDKTEVSTCADDQGYTPDGAETAVLTATEASDDNTVCVKSDKDLPLHQDLILDILYNLFQPISIMIVAAIMYFLIRTVGYGGMGGP